MFYLKKEKEKKDKFIHLGQGPINVQSSLPTATLSSMLQRSRVSQRNLLHNRRVVSVFPQCPQDGNKYDASILAERKMNKQIKILIFSPYKISNNISSSLRKPSLKTVTTPSGINWVSCTGVLKRGSSRGSLSNFSTVLPLNLL